MPRMFRAISPTIVAQRTKIASYWDDEKEHQPVKIKYNHMNDEHNELILSCTQSVNTMLGRLQSIDMKIVSTFACGLAAFMFSWILPFGPIAMAAFFYGAYQIQQRQQPYIEFRLAHENLLACCAWSLNGYEENKVAQNVIEGMFASLAPIMSAQQIKTISSISTESEVASKMLQEAEIKLNESLAANPLFPYFTLEEQKSLYYQLYGLDQGSFQDMIESLFYVIRASSRIFHIETANIPNSQNSLQFAQI